ncbi:MAG TPA: glycosyltransferase family 2 protein [Nitriliruptorales bacterium]|nr:glycosyltransferase family 2 protein [Nitriliruptorales bacterium]
MRVSIVVNNHNYRPYLGACIDSALNQTQPDVEVVVVDDGSTDGSVDVVRAYGDRVVPVLKTNGGQASAFNAGFAAATGEAVIFLDADDLLEPSAAATAARLLADPQVVKTHWPLTVVDEAGAPTGALKPGPARELPDGDLRATVFQRGPTCLLSPPTSGNAWSRGFLERVLPMDEALFRLGADTLLFEVAPFAGHVRRWCEPLSRYRLHGGNRWRRLGFDEILRRQLAFYAACVPVAARIATEQGVAVDPARWLEHSWWHRLQRAVRRVEEVVAPGLSYLLADGGRWGLVPSATRRPRPFPGRAGVYWGPPADDRHATSELERERAAGAAAFVLAWPSFWWLDHYEGFVRHLERSYRCAARDDCVVVFDLQAPTPRTPPAPQGSPSARRT